MQPRYKILVVEDNVPSANLLKEVLEQMNYKVILATDGGKAVEMATTEIPDLAIIDVMLPTLNGFEVCGQLKRNPQLADIPIIMLTVLNESHHRIRAIQAGANDFLTKPFNRLELLTKVKYLLSRKDEYDLKEDFNDITYCLLIALEYRYPHIALHSRRVAKLSEELSRRLGLMSLLVTEIKTGALLHDIGKLACTDMDEWDKHPEIGYKMVEKFHRPVIQNIILDHHSKIRLTEDYTKADESKLAVHIVAMCDRFDKMVNLNILEKSKTNLAIERLSAEACANIWNMEVLNRFKDFISLTIDQSII